MPEPLNVPTLHAVLVPTEVDVTGVTAGYEAWAGELERYVAGAFGGRVVPEDVVHEVFARLIRETSAGREPTILRAMLASGGLDTERGTTPRLAA